MNLQSTRKIEKVTGTVSLVYVAFEQHGNE